MLEQGRARRILLVEDEWLVAVETQVVLRRAGYAVDEFVSDATRVLAVFDRMRPDLVLLDFDLGGPVDGGQLAEQIRTRSSVPLVFLSGHSDAATLRRVMRSSPQGFVVKPHTEAQLVTAVEMALFHPAKDASPENDPRETLSRIAALLDAAGLSPRASEAPKTRPMPSLVQLSGRERQILDGLLSHQRVPGIAKALDISENTVRNHLKSIYSKLGVHSQEQLLELVVRGGKDRN